MGILLFGLFVDDGRRTVGIGQGPLRLEDGGLFRLRLLTGFLSSNKLPNVGRRITSLEIGEPLETLAVLGSFLTGRRILIF